MKPLDTNYLSLQFKQKIYSKNGTNFQSFFENIMEKKFPEFQKIKPYGNRGDGGNDGYIKSTGSYYQIYAPEVPAIKQAEAAKKLIEDFNKLKLEWDRISEVKEYFFVFNDKYLGSTQNVENAISEVEEQNPGIHFDKILAVDIERIFFSLNESSILDLGFNIDHRHALTIAYQQFEKIQIEIDRENSTVALKMLNSLKEIIVSLNDDNIILEYRILESICLSKTEKIEIAITSYENLVVEYPDDPRPSLHLAEIYLRLDQYKKNQKSLEKAEAIDCDSWLLKFQKLARMNTLGEKIDIEGIDINQFSSDPRIKSIFYRFYASCFEKSGDTKKADSFIQKAIRLNPNRFHNQTSKLEIIEGRFFSSEDFPDANQLNTLLDQVENIESEFFIFGDIGDRNRLYLKMKKFYVFWFTENFIEFEKNAKECFELALSCYFDSFIDCVLISILKVVQIPNDSLDRLKNYTQNFLKNISDDLANQFICQFNIKDTILTEGKAFFSKIGKKNI